MIYLSPLSRALMTLRHPMLGVMVTPGHDRTIPAGVPWAADCSLRVARSADPADVDAYLRWLDRSAHDRAMCLFAVAPDVYADADATWQRSAPLLGRIRVLGYPAALVAQDGFSADAVDWSMFDVLFIGGSRSWKRAERGGWAAVSSGVRRGVAVHVGRVNGGPFLRQVAAAGARSADGTGLARAERNLWPRVRRWLGDVAAQPSLLGVSA